MYCLFNSSVSIETVAFMKVNITIIPVELYIATTLIVSIVKVLEQLYYITG